MKTEIQLADNHLNHSRKNIIGGVFRGKSKIS